MSKISRILFCVAAAAAILCICLMGGRNDGERIAVADDTGRVSFNIDSGSKVSIIVCLNEDNPDLSSNQIILSSGEVGDALELVGPRPLSLPEDIASELGIAQSLKCSVSDVFVLDELENNTIAIDSIPKAFVIAAVSQAGGEGIARCLFFVFLATLIAGVGIESLKRRKSSIQFRPVDGAFGFFVGVVVSTLIAFAALQSVEANGSLLPQFGEMLILVGSNFVGFILTYIGFAAFRYYWNRKKQLGGSAQIEENTDANVPQFKPYISILLGFGLAVLAAFSTIFVPLPGLSTLELASQLTSTLYMSAFFAVLAGVCEECLFRGLIQSSFEARPSSRHPRILNTFAVVIASALFVSLHVEQSLDHLWALVPIACVSIVSGILKIRYKSLYPCMLLHMTYNATLLIPSILI